MDHVRCVRLLMSDYSLLLRLFICTQSQVVNKAHIASEHLFVHLRRRYYPSEHAHKSNLAHNARKRIRKIPAAFPTRPFLDHSLLRASTFPTSPSFSYSLSLVQRVVTFRKFIYSPLHFLQSPPEWLLFTLLHVSTLCKSCSEIYTFILFFRT